MKLLQVIHQSFIMLCLITTLAGQKRFECNGELLISTSDGNTTLISRPLTIPFSIPLLSTLASYSGNFDALGFNPKDNYVYCVEQNTNTIVRLSLYNTIERIGKVSIVDTLRSNAGDCTSDGLYVCYDYGLKKMLVFDVVDGFKLLRQINLFWDPTSPNNGPFKTRIFDFAFDPNDTKTAYSYQGNFKHPDLAPDTTRGYLLKINLNFDDPNLGMVTPLRKMNPDEVTHISGLVFDPRSNLFGYGSSQDGLNPLQSNLFSINPFQGQITPFISNSSGDILSDACSCPFSLTFTNRAPIEGMFCNNDTKTFVLSFENNSYIALNDVLLKDTFPEGTIIKSISNTFTGKVDTGTGIGTNILSISGFLINPKEKVQIRIEITSINAKDGDTYNQAFMQNLPPRFPASISSDDPDSFTFGDRSNFYFKTRKIEKLSWKIIPPTDCFIANDGKIVVSSPEFAKGEGYEVSLRNQIGFKEYISTVVIDEKNSFTIDSLFPGDYQLFRFRSLSENCSVSLKDTSIVLKAPNDLLNLQVCSNSPVCEGESISLKSLMSPAGQIKWTGPEIFGSENINPVIENATLMKKGKFEVIASYGYCSQSKTVNVEVRKQVITSIEGGSNYCIRDTMRLAVVTKEKDASLKYLWLGPNNLNKVDSVLMFPIVGSKQSGYYEVITTNGACYDTVGMVVNVLPTPTLALDDIIMTDYCDPLILIPKLIEYSDVTYQWFPQDGLSCTDCPNPRVEPIVKTNYHLKVTNEYNCVDSASTQIILDKSKLAFAPNIFSRTSTSDNKQFKIFPNCVVRYIHRLAIYDRFGNLVFNTTALGPDDTLENWDGLILGKNASSGVFVWRAKAELVDGSIVYLTGDVTLL